MSPPRPGNISLTVRKRHGIAFPVKTIFSSDSAAQKMSGRIAFLLRALIGGDLASVLDDTRQLVRRHSRTIGLLTRYLIAMGILGGAEIDALICPGGPLAAISK
jgi:hypothetical protein